MSTLIGTVINQELSKRLAAKNEYKQETVPEKIKRFEIRIYHPVQARKTELVIINKERSCPIIYIHRSSWADANITTELKHEGNMCTHHQWCASNSPEEVWEEGGIIIDDERQIIFPCPFLNCCRAPGLLARFTWSNSLINKYCFFIYAKISYLFHNHLYSVAEAW